MWALASRLGKPNTWPVHEVVTQSYRFDMSFDIYFVPRRADGDWDAAMEALEEAAGQELQFSAADEVVWQRIRSEVEDELPGAEEFSGESHRELSYEPIGLQLSMSVGEISVSVAYWSDGEEALRTVEKLRRIAALVESATGLVAYDPQAGGPFLDGQPSAATSAFDKARVVLDEPQASGPPSEAPKRRWSPFRRK